MPGDRQWKNGYDWMRLREQPISGEKGPPKRLEEGVENSWGEGLGSSRQRVILLKGTASLSGPLQSSTALFLPCFIFRFSFIYFCHDTIARRPCRVACRPKYPQIERYY